MCALWGVRVDGWEVAGLQACVVEEEENENLSDSSKKRRHHSQRNNRQLSSTKKKRTKYNSGKLSLPMLRLLSSKAQGSKDF